MTATMTDLGLCGAYLAEGRCDGRMLVTGDEDGFLVAQCDGCGCEAACPPGARKRAQEIEERPERWWDD